MSLRRLLLLALLLSVGAAAFSRVRSQRSAHSAAAPEWPPFEPTIVPNTEPSTESTSPSEGRASVPDTDARPADDVWVVPGADGGAPDGYPVKVKLSSGIFHVPGGRFYDRTTADRCYPSAAAAAADGYRPSKS